MNNTKNIDDWRRKAFALTASDASMGMALSKMIDFMSTVTKDGLGAPNISFALDSLQRERSQVMDFDEKKTDALRSVIYGVSECVGTMVSTLVDQNAKLLEQVEQLTRTLNSINEEGDFGGGNHQYPDVATGSGASYYDDDVVEADSMRGVVVKEEANRKRSRPKSITSQQDGSDDESDRSNSAPVRRVDPRKTKRCHHCSKMFTSTGARANHMFSIHGDADKPRLACTHCGLAFARTDRLQDHLRKLHNILPFQCSTCDAEFDKRKQLVEHWEESGHSRRSTQDE
ncbi:hypothetical protein PRIPAC_85408 [Pristionchus pacificus]|uniref:Zinc finger protein n=1 Tax=Pristionchus pacificus TaxID=54126 RepID=A0A2A6BMT4_PRIPA|nr:hypothetical protein PRIPAC_85408 [Pristionchus pacificus]|eukprot:PDM67227.1 zinc finger protein [Pristionchus pacificus]